MLTPRGQPWCWIKRIAFHLSTDCTFHILLISTLSLTTTFLTWKQIRFYNPAPCRFRHISARVTVCFGIWEAGSCLSSTCHGYTVVDELLLANSMGRTKGPIMLSGWASIVTIVQSYCISILLDLSPKTVRPNDSTLLQVCGVLNPLRHWPGLDLFHSVALSSMDYTTYETSN